VGVGGALVTSRELSAFSQAQPVSLLQLQSSLAEGELVIEYVSNRPVRSRFAITRDRIAHYELKSRNEIESAVELIWRPFETGVTVVLKQRHCISSLLQPVALLGHSTRVVIVPDGKAASSGI